MEAMELFDRHESSITPEACRRNAMCFTRERFRAAMLDLVALHMHPDKAQPGDEADSPINFVAEEAA